MLGGPVEEITIHQYTDRLDAEVGGRWNARLSTGTQFSPVVGIENSPPSGDGGRLFGADEPGFELVP